MCTGELGPACTAIACTAIDCTAIAFTGTVCVGGGGAGAVKRPSLRTRCRAGPCTLQRWMRPTGATS